MPHGEVRRGRPYHTLALIHNQNLNDFSMHLRKGQRHIANAAGQREVSGKGNANLGRLNIPMQPCAERVHSCSYVVAMWLVAGIKLE